MATMNVILRRSELAGADLSSSQFTLVKYNASGDLVQAVANDRAFVLLDNPSSGQYGTIALAGIAKVVAGGTIAAGDPLASDANGHAIKQVTAGDNVVAQALEAGVSGDTISVLVVAGATA